MMYEWVKALHIISIIAWMAGLLYLPRLMVYHVDAEAGSQTSEVFKVMERRLLKAIMTPAMIASWVFGLWLMILAEAWSEPWFHLKALLVIALSGVHGFQAKWVRLFAQDRNTRSAKFYRIWNEAPTLIMIAVVFVVVIKPF